MARSRSLKYIVWLAVRIDRHVGRVRHVVKLYLQSRFSSREQKASRPSRLQYEIHYDVIKGRDGFLFHRDHDMLEQLAGIVVLRDRQIDVWARALRRRIAWCAANSAEMRILLIPEKHVVYRELLPPSIKISQRRPVTQLIGSLEDSVRDKIVYPLDPLRQAGASRPTFLKTDTHWTSFGAFIAYQALMRSLAPKMRLDILEEKDLIWNQRPMVVGDLGVRFEPELGERVDVASPPGPCALTFANRIFNRGALHVFAGHRSDLPRCVLFRDSFSNDLIPFLMHNFSRIVAVSTLSCLYDLLEVEKPQVVIFATIERFLGTFGRDGFIELPDDFGGVSFQSLTGIELGRLKENAPANP